MFAANNAMVIFSIQISSIFFNVGAVTCAFQRGAGVNNFFRRNVKRMNFFNISPCTYEISVVILNSKWMRTRPQFMKGTNYRRAEKKEVRSQKRLRNSKLNDPSSWIIHNPSRLTQLILEKKFSICNLIFRIVWCQIQ